ncbi:hypothetical protein [Chondrinema litorale]|uniref:hypothetical protein n=1 Tax=Chondrinema litorale TaxID=2994555 RepID=UPI0025438F64|nr:hypothetical protein [Chondrinema litorale]UZR97532.1 hypothetical protein OQ292_26260 [Chondrinema litorale]
MKCLFLTTTCFLILQGLFAQDNTVLSDAMKYYQMVKVSENTYRAEIQSDVDSTWDKWNNRGYNFGFDKHTTPMYTTINGIISTPYMVQVRGNENEKNRKRWGFHVFEGYARDDKSRITMLVNKHTELEKPVAEMYYYGTVYNHSAPAYNWFKIGSDVRHHSFMFSRDQAVFYGSLKLSNALTLGQIGKDNIRKDQPEGDDETNSVESAKHVNYVSLRDGEDGTMFYDKDNDIVVIKVDGQWMKLRVEPLPKGVKYDF